MSDRKLVIPLIFGLMFVLGFIPESFAANDNLFVSAENSQFDNYMSGPQVILVAIVDDDIIETEEPRAEPDVTVNGKILRMVQGIDGVWYGFFADRNMALIADATTDTNSGEGLDFGTVCTSAGDLADAEAFIGESGDDLDLSDSNGVAVGATSCDGTGADDTLQNVLREAKDLNENIADSGQIGVEPDSWPFIQLYTLSIGGNVVVQYNKGGGAQITTLTFDTVENFAGLELDKSRYSNGDEVHVTITDLWLNIDPTDEDSWTFGTGGTSTNYQVFDEHGNTVGDTITNTDSDLTNALTNLMCEDNCILLINTDVQGKGAVLTLQDNVDSEIRPTNPSEDGDPQNPAAWETIGGNISGDFPVTITEQSRNSGVFGSYDETDVSNLVITNEAKRGTSASIDYNEVPVTILVGFGFASIDIDVSDGEWNSGEEVPVMLFDIDANKNSRADEDLDLYKPKVLIIPSLTTGDPFTLAENDDSNGALLDVTILGTGQDTTIAVDKFSKRAILSANNPADAVTGIIIDLGATAANLHESINDPQADFSGFNFFNIDVRSFTSGNVDVTILADSGDVSVVTDVGAQSFTNLEGAVENNLNAINPTDQISLEITFLTPITIGDLGPKEAFVADFFSFGFFNDGLTSPERVANQIIRLELEENRDNSSTFEGSLEYTMVNQLNILDAATYTGLSTIADDPNFIVIEDFTNQDSPRINYLDLGADGVSTQISDQEEAPSHSGIVSFDNDSYKIADTVTIRLEDADLNVDSDLIDIFTIVDPAVADPARDTIGIGGLPEFSFGSLGRLLDVTFDDAQWRLDIDDGCVPLGDAGLGATGFTLVETDIASGIFLGGFQVPVNWCRPGSDTPEITPGLDIEVNYVDFRDASGAISEVGDSAGIRANTGSVSLDRTLYPVPFGSVEDFFPSQSQSDSSDPEGNSIFPVHQTAVSADGDQNIDVSTEEIGPGDLILHIRVNDPDFNVVDNAKDSIALGEHGPVKVMVSRGSETLLLATAGGLSELPGVITHGSAVVPNVTRELGPIFEINPDAGIFEIDLQIRYTDGPSSMVCPLTPDGGYSSINGDSGVLGRFDVIPTDGSYCIMRDDVITVEYTDPADASGDPNIVVDFAIFDTMTGVLQADNSVYLIGQDMIFTLIDIDLNLDSNTQESYDLDLFEWQSSQIVTTLGDLGGGDAFDPEPLEIRETGDNTGIFQVVVEIPEEILGKLVLHGEKINFQYSDWSPSGTKYVGVQEQKVDLSIFTAAVLLYCDRNFSDYDNVIVGTNGNDKLKGTNLDDLIIGLGGKDNLTGMKGDDCLIGGLGNDKLNGGQGIDICITDLEDKSSPVQCEG